MMRLLIPVLLLAACSGGPKVPKDILPPPKMERIMWDMMQADGFMLNPVPSDSLSGRQARRTELYQLVLHIHKVDKASFARSMKFYEAHPELLKDVVGLMEKQTDKRPDFTADTARKRKSLLPKSVIN